MLAYDLAHAAAGVETARAMLDYGAKGDVEAAITCAFVADVVARPRQPRSPAARSCGASSPAPSTAPGRSCATYRDPDFLAGLADVDGPRHLDDDFELVQDTFRRFAEEKIAPAAEHVHRANGDVPEDIIAGLGEMGAFGLSVPEQYGGCGQRRRVTTTSAWWSPPRSCPAARSASAARSSPGPRSSPARW